MTLTARMLVDQLGLLPHPEGGFFRETYRDTLTVAGLPERFAGPTFAGPRSASTAIYYLLERGDMSALHRIASDEVWHHYAGGTLTVHVLHPDGRHEALRVGTDFAAGERPQAVVPAGAWFGARLEGPEDREAFALVGCTVAPGFAFEDLEIGTRASLLESFPQHEAVVSALTREWR